MNDSYEPSYYEIALTGRQALATFVVLLVCLLVAFFSGLWIGQGGAQGEDLAADGGAVEEVTGPPDDLTSGDQVAEGAGEEEGIESLSFFGEDEAGEPPAADEPRSPERQSPEEARQERQRREQEARQERERQAEERREQEARERQAQRDAEAERSEPERSEPSEPARAEATPSASPTTGDLVIQVISTNDEAKARQVLGQLTSRGFRAFLSPVNVDGQTFHRVRIGPFEQQGDAEAVAARVEALGLDTWITR